VIIDLKVGKLDHADLGQMQLYSNWYDEEILAEGDNPSIGLILCTEKNDAVVRYVLAERSRQVFASRYQLYLPTEAQLQQVLQRELARVERSAAAPAQPNQDTPQARGGPALRQHRRTLHAGAGRLSLRRLYASARQSVRDVRNTVEEPGCIRQMLFGGFRRRLYPVQKFKSGTERRLALILECDAERWFRPANGQFPVSASPFMASPGRICWCRTLL
jgi:hypothetical protein